MFREWTEGQNRRNTFIMKKWIMVHIRSRWNVLSRFGIARKYRTFDWKIRWQYLKEYCLVLFLDLLLSGKLNQHLYEVDEKCY